MTTDRLFDRIAHPTDLKQGSEIAFFHALRVAAATGSDLDLLHVSETPHVTTWDAYPGVRETLEAWKLEAGEPKSKARPPKVVKVAAYGKEPFGPIVSYFKERLPDLIVLATHQRRGLDRWLHREIAEKVARGGVCTLFVPFGADGFVSPSTGRVSLRHVLMPIDWVPHPQAAADELMGLLELLSTEVKVTLLHVADNVDVLPDVEISERDGVSVERLLWNGDPVEKILEAAERDPADLVAMVTAGHHGFLDALRGSTTERVLRQLRCPLMAIHGR